MWWGGMRRRGANRHGACPAHHTHTRPPARTRGVVRARVQQHHAALGHAAQVLQHARRVQPARGGVVIPVALQRARARVRHHLHVVLPRGVTAEDAAAGQRAADEVGGHGERARAGERLARQQAALARGRAVGAKQQRARRRLWWWWWWWQGGGKGGGRREKGGGRRDSLSWSRAMHHLPWSWAPQPVPPTRRDAAAASPIPPPA
jgi:hypothetical protein